MSNQQLDSEKVRSIVRLSYDTFKKKGCFRWTKGQAIDEIVKGIKKELKDDANSEN